MESTNTEFGDTLSHFLMNQSLAAGFVSNSQKIRVMSEDWTESKIICPACGSQLKKAPNNAQVLDFCCSYCVEEYELKSQSKPFAQKVSDGAYHSMITRLDAPKSPHFFFMSYDKAHYEVRNFFVVPSHFLRPISIEKRKPLAVTARRAGWVGCNILLNQIPKAGRIDCVKNGSFIDSDIVLGQWKKTAFLAKTPSLESRGWTIDILKCTEQIGKNEFSLQDMYKFEAVLANRYPENKHIKDKIRQQLQILRDTGFIDFVGRGRYRIIKN